MLNLLQKSVKTVNDGICSIVNGITSENCFKSQIDFCKFDILNLNFLRVEKENSSINNDSELLYKEFNVLYLIHNKYNLSVYHVGDDFDHKKISSVKFNFNINSVDSLNLSLNCRYAREMPIIALTSNQITTNTHNLMLKSNEMCTVIQKTESFIKFYSIKSKRVVHNLRFRKKIIQFISKINYIAISFADSSIKLFDNDTINEFATIITASNLKSNVGKLSNSILSSTLYTNSGLIKNNSNDIGVAANSTNSSNNIDENSNSYYIYSVPIFDCTDSYLLFFNNKSPEDEEKRKLEKDNTFSKSPEGEKNHSAIYSNIANNSNSTYKKKIKIKDITCSNKQQELYSANSSIENIATDTYHNISKVKDWTISQIKDLSNLRKAANLKNNIEIKTNLSTHKIKSEKSNSTATLTLIKLNIQEINNYLNGIKKNKDINSSNENEKNSLIFLDDNSLNITVPFFEDGVSLIKFFNEGRYFIVSNKNSQMFYLYELYPQSNLKYTSSIDSYDNSSFNSICNFKIIYSFYRGITSASVNCLDLSAGKNFSVIASNKGTYHLFNLPNRDNHIIENVSSFKYDNFDEINQKVICGRDFAKIKLGNKLLNYTYKSTCKLINLSENDINKYFTQEIKDNILNLKFGKSAKGTALLTYTENDPAIHVYILNNSKLNKNTSKYHLLKKLDIDITETFHSELIEKNLNEITRRLNMSNNTAKNYKDYIELDTTDKNYPIVHTNPFFNFNIIRNRQFNNNKIFNTNNFLVIENDNNDPIKIKTNSIFDISSSPKNINLRIENITSFSLSKKVYPLVIAKKSRSDSINISNKFLSNCFNQNNNKLSTTFLNDLNIYEQIICQEIEYTPKLFDKKIFPIAKNDFITENYLIPKTIFYTNSNYLIHNKLFKSLNKKSSISDHSSSVDNSISLTGINQIVDVTNDLDFYSTNTNSNLNNILKVQLKKDMESNISDTINKNNKIVKIMANFNINDNYINK